MAVRVCLIMLDVQVPSRFHLQRRRVLHPGTHLGLPAKTSSCADKTRSGILPAISQPLAGEDLHAARTTNEDNRATLYKTKNACLL